MKYLTSVGLDVHARSIKAAALSIETGELKERGFMYDDPDLIGWLKSLPQPVHCVYESGPTGFDLLHRLEAEGIACQIGAVTKMLRPSGDRIKNDKRDAQFLARMLATNNIVPIYIPTDEEESARDLCRAREDVRQSLTRAKQHLSKFLLRKGIVYTEGKAAWTQRHRSWLASLKFPTEAEQVTFDEYLLTIKEAERRRERLDANITTLAMSGRWEEIVLRLRCLRGIGTITAFALACEIGDFSRFKNASAFSSYLGLVPSLKESGESSVRGRITKTGNCHLRKLVVEAAWCHARRFRPYSEKKEPFFKTVDPAIALEAQKANLRLRDRSEHFKQRKLPPCKANVAIARELSGWIWHIALMKL
jgi:transposase